MSPLGAVASPAIGPERSGDRAEADWGADSQFGGILADDAAAAGAPSARVSAHNAKLVVERKGDRRAGACGTRGVADPSGRVQGEMQASTVVHGDETGWRENERNGHIWALVTGGPEAVRYFEYDQSRGHQVARRILGDDFRGWLVTHSHAAYNLILCQHQRCWVHWLRDLHELRETHAATVEVVTWATAVRKLYEDA